MVDALIPSRGTHWGVLARLTQFNLLPSLFLHPGQVKLLSPPNGMDTNAARHPAVQAALHRQWSQRLLARLNVAASPVVNLKEPALPLALMAAEQLDRLVRELGIALLGRRLRRMILRDDVLAVRASLGETGMRWALEGARELHPGLLEAPPVSPQGSAQAADLLGASLLGLAWHDAPQSLRLRADWRVAPEAHSEQARGVCGLGATEARVLCLRRLTETDPEWLSCFPETR
ncbi:MAG: SctK family type III secretion system sorting platform protein [Proteobacteria bacterium]|nr:SctK family type III secretion system sorting platform protein [Pseudomonadota bacterium]